MANARARRLGLALLLLLASDGAAQDSTELQVVVEGVESGAGQVVVALFDSAATHLQRGQQLRRRAASAMPGRVRVRFDNLDPRRYSLVAFHDADGDGDMKRSAIGLPLEGLGFSNDRRIGLFGPPSFEDAAVKLNRGRNETRVTLRY